MGLTMTKSERFSACANRSQSHMCRATVSAPISLSPALRVAPSRWEGADDMRMASGSRYARQVRMQKLPPFPMGRGWRYENEAMQHSCKILRKKELFSQAVLP